MQTAQDKDKRASWSIVHFFSRRWAIIVLTNIIFFICTCMIVQSYSFMSIEDYIDCKIASYMMSNTCTCTSKFANIKIKISKLDVSQITLHVDIIILHADIVFWQVDIIY